MKKYLFIVLLVGVWSCGKEDGENSIIGDWLLVNESIMIISVEPDSLYHKVDSVYSRYIDIDNSFPFNIIYSFKEDSLVIKIEMIDTIKYDYRIENDSLMVYRMQVDEIGDALGFDWDSMGYVQYDNDKLTISRNEKTGNQNINSIPVQPIDSVYTTYSVKYEFYIDFERIE